MTSDLTTRIGLDWPLIQAPLGGGPSTPELVAAVSNAGALGSLGAAYLTPKDIESTIAAIRRLTTKPFGVNLFAPQAEPRVTAAQIDAAVSSTVAFRAELGLARPALEPPYSESFAAQLEVVLAVKPKVFSFTFGMIDARVIASCRSSGILTMGTATTVDEALALQAAGVDVVIAQGVEAGGHRGSFSPDQPHQPDLPDSNDTLLSTTALTRALVAALKIPVVASGGIMDGQGIAAALRLGAQAAALGTAFLLCPEAGTTTPYRESLRAARGAETRFTRSFSGRWARGIENRFMREMDAHASAVLPFPAQNAFTRDIRKAASARGRTEFLSLWAGQGLGLIREMKAADLVRALRAETEEALGKGRS